MTGLLKFIAKVCRTVFILGAYSAYTQIYKVVAESVPQTYHKFMNIGRRYEVPRGMPIVPTRTIALPNKKNKFYKISMSFLLHFFNLNF